MRARTESALLLVALALVAAFLGSFAIGLIGEPEPDGGEPGARYADPPGADTGAAVPGATAARVEVLNASGTAGLARRATDALRAAGFDVVYFGNAPADASPDSTLVLDRTGDAAGAEGVARALGAGRVESRPDASLLLDVTVLLGKDWPRVPATTTR